MRAHFVLVLAVGSALAIVAPHAEAGALHVPDAPTCTTSTPVCPAWTRAEGRESAIEGPATFVIQDEAAWQDLLARHGNGGPTVDFSTHWVAVAIGPQYSYWQPRTVIESVARDPATNTHLVTVARWDLGGGGDVSSTPWSIAVVERLDSRPVAAVFVEAPEVVCWELASILRPAVPDVMRCT